MIRVDGVALHQRNDHEAAAVGERADLECNPGDRAESADGRGGGQERDHDRPAFACTEIAGDGVRRTRRPRRRAGPGPDNSRGSRRRAPAAAYKPSARASVALVARRQLGPSCPTPAWTATAASAAPAPVPRRAPTPVAKPEEQRRQRDDHHDARDDEAESADHRPQRAARR